MNVLLNIFKLVVHVNVQKLQFLQILYKNPIIISIIIIITPSHLIDKHTSSDALIRFSVATKESIACLTDCKTENTANELWFDT